MPKSLTEHTLVVNKTLLNTNNMCQKLIPSRH